MSHKPIKGTLKVISRTAKSAVLDIYGPIGKDWFGDGVTAEMFSKELRALGDVTTIDLHINSEGGVVTEARDMYNRLVQHPATINVHINGWAASAASFLAMAGDHITIAEGAFFMIHNARGSMSGPSGEAKAFREHAKKSIKVANDLELFNDTIRDTYIARTGIDPKQIRDWMDAETYFTGKEAFNHGFADELDEYKQRVAASMGEEMPPWINNVPLSIRPNRAKVLAFRRKQLV